MTGQFDAYFRKNAPALHSFALKLSKNAMDADDLVQETAIKAFTNFHKFRSDSNFKSWTFTILKNTFISKYRKRKKTNIASLPVEDLEYAITPTYQAPLETSNKKVITYLKKCIAELSPKSKKPFTMYINGYQYDEIASGLNIPIGTVKSRISYARKKLKVMITDDNFLEAA